MSRSFDEDYFQGTEMSIGEHLEELRKALVSALLAVAIGTLVGLYFCEWVVALIKSPLEASLQEYYSNVAGLRAEGQLRQLRELGLPAPDPMMAALMAEAEGRMPQLVEFSAEQIFEAFAELTEVENLSGLQMPPIRLIAPDDVADLSIFAKRIRVAASNKSPSPGRRLWAMLAKVGSPLQADEDLPANSAKSKDLQQTQDQQAQDQQTQDQQAQDQQAQQNPGGDSSADKPERKSQEGELVISTKAQQLLILAAEGEKLNAEQLRQLFSDINEALRHRDFYQQEAFQSVVSTDKSWLSIFGSKPSRLEQALSGLDQLKETERGRLHLYLLARAFPNVILPNTTQSGTFRLVQWMPVGSDPRTRVQTLSATEPFFIYLQAAILFGLVISSPISFYFLWEFVAAGLYPHEKRYVHVFLPFSVLLFLFGAAIAFFVVFQFVLAFLLSFNLLIGTDPNIRMSEWLGFALLLPVGFGVAFQLPLLMLFLERIGIFTIDNYWDKWKLAVMAICVISALLTPADPMSMVILAGSLTPLYLLGIKLCEWWPRSANPFPEPVEVV